MLMHLRGLYCKSLMLSRKVPRLGRQAAWLVIPYAAVQLIRLITNVALTRLLAPEVFGVMLLIHSLRTGTELLSDLGIGQSVVRSPNAEDKSFLDVAWTLQVVRGLLLSLVIVVTARPISALYAKPDMFQYILAISPIFVISGAQSPGIFLAQRHMHLARRAVFDVASTLAHSLFAIALSFAMSSVWALVFGLLLGSLFSTVISYFVFQNPQPKFKWMDKYAKEIVSFGKWIFLSTAVYFAAISFDRFYFVGVLPLAVAGIYGVARTFSDMLGALAQHAGAYLVFPRVASMQDRLTEAAPRLRAVRQKVLAVAAVLMGVSIAVSDKFILMAYDERYHLAAFLIPLLLTGVWFGILASFTDAMLMGCGRPAPGALANGLKFLTQLIGLPLAMLHGGFFAAIGVMIVGEIARWLTLYPSSLKRGLNGPYDDIVLTVLMCATALGTKLSLGLMGVVPTFHAWWRLQYLLQA